MSCEGILLNVPTVQKPSHFETKNRLHNGVTDAQNVETAVLFKRGVPLRQLAVNLFLPLLGRGTWSTRGPVGDEKQSTNTLTKRSIICAALYGLQHAGCHVLRCMPQHAGSHVPVCFCSMRKHSGHRR